MVLKDDADIAAQKRNALARQIVEIDSIQQGLAARGFLNHRDNL